MFFVKIARCFQFGHLVLKWVRFCGGKFRSQNEDGLNIKMGNENGEEWRHFFNMAHHNKVNQRVLIIEDEATTVTGLYEIQ